MKKQLLTILTIAAFVFTASAQPWALNFDNTANGAEGQSVRLNELDDTTFAPLMLGATSYTLEAWVKPTSAVLSGDVIFSMRNTYRVTMWSNNRFYFTHKLGGNNTFVNSVDNALTPDVWQHIAVICDENDGANGSVKLYVNGVLVNAASSDALTLDTDANCDVFIGYASSSTHYPNMQAREIRFKNTAEPIANLNTTDVLANYTTDANTAVLFHFSEGIGIVTENAASGIDANLGFGGSRYPTWLDLSVLSVDNNNLIDFNLYPNPVTEKVFSIQANESIKNVQIFDVLGKSVKAVEVSERTTQLNIDVNNLSQGIYFVKTATDAGIGTQKIIIQ